MENIQNIGKTQYESTSAVVHSSFKNFLIFVQLFFVVTFYIFIGIFQYIFKFLFVWQKPKDITGQVALVTGGGNGFGREICLRLAKEKCKIAIVDVDLENAVNLAKEIISKGGKAVAYKVDVSRYEEVEALRENVNNDLGFVDILVNNAGLLPLLSLREGKHEDAQKIINVNLTAHVWTNRVFLRDMYARKKGHIVAISSVFGMIGVGRCVLYCTTKFGIRGFMDSLAEELCYNGMEGKIFTTCVHPFAMSTRKDFIDILEKHGLLRHNFFISPQHAANVLIKAIKSNTKSLTIPRGMAVFCSIILLFPIKIRRNIMRFISGGDIPEVYPMDS